jgi:general secretion pathway protein D
LNPASREPLTVRFTNASIRDILNFIANASGINITFDPGFQDRAYTVQLEGVTLEEALRQILSVNNLFYKVLNQRTLIVVPETPANRAKYDEQVIQTFYLSHADATEMAQLLTNITRIVGIAIQPVIIANRGANTITVRATAPMVAIISQVIGANDKPQAEIIIDVEILEVNRNRAQTYGLFLSSYTIGGIFSPEAAPGADAVPFNLNTISQGVSTADFYLSVPTAAVQALESDATTRLLAKPQLRGAEGTKLTLNLGQDIPVVSTTYTPIAQGGAGINPLTSFSYRPVGIIVEMTPRVTYEGDVLLELTLESSSLGAPINVAGTSAPSFNSRKVTTKLRLRDGESNLLAGLLQEDERRQISGLPGLIHVPGLRALFAANGPNEIVQTDIVMLLTPRVIRTHQLSQKDLNPIYIGSQGNLGLTGPPPLIAPPAEPEPAPAPAAPAAPAPGGRPPTPTAPPGSSPVPGTVLPPTAAPPAPPTPQAAPVTPQGALVTPVPAPAPPAARPTPPGPIAPAQIAVTPPSPEFQIAGGPYTVPISVSGASRFSTVSLTMTFNPQALRVRTIQEGSFMRQGGLNATFTQQVDPTVGRVDMTITRPGDAVGASGTGLLGVVLFDAVGAGSSMLALSGVAATPEGTPIPLTFTPATVVVR